MAIETQRFIRKPLYVDAIKVTPQNFDAIVSWCKGEVMQDDVPGRGRSKKYIKVEVHNPKTPRQTKAKVGDWILKTEKGYKIYTDKAFHESFHLPEEDHRNVEETTEDFIRGSDEIIPGVTIADAVHMLQTQASRQAEVGPDMELVSATPQSIADAVVENEAARAQNLEEIIEQRANLEAKVRSNVVPTQTNPHVAEGRVEEKIADAVEPTPAKPTMVTEPTVEVEGGVQVNDSESAPPPVREGKRVLTLKEQEEMDPDEIRGLIQSGEVILAQDLAA